MKTMIFNINTGANDSAMNFFEPKQPRMTKKGEIHASDKSIEEQIETFKQNAALNALTGKVLVISLKINDAPIVHLEGNEADIIEEFWTLQSHCEQFITFNGNKFDWPFLIQRSWILGITLPILPDRPKKDSNYIDLMEVWACGNYKEFVSLTNLCKALSIEAGLKITSPEISERFQWFYENEHDKAIQYCADEITATELTFNKLVRR